MRSSGTGVLAMIRLIAGCENTSRRPVQLKEDDRAPARGQLFMAGILPGLLLTALFMAAVALVTLRDPEAGPRGERVSVSKRLRALPMVTVIVVSIGGIYLGVFTPVEAAGVGAGLVILMAIGMRKLEWRMLKQAVSDTVGTTAMLCFIVIGASVLNPFLALTHVPACWAKP